MTMTPSTTMPFPVRSSLGRWRRKPWAQMRKISEKIYHAVDASGLARVDFFMEKSGRVLFNELNTMPDFTSISMYPMLWEEEGMSRTELMDRLIALALERDNGIHG